LEIIQSKSKKKSEESLRDNWDSIKQVSMHIMEIKKRERRD
jgi:hypothetical protein